MFWMLIVETALTPASKESTDNAPSSSHKMVLACVNFGKFKVDNLGKVINLSAPLMVSSESADSDLICVAFVATISPVKV